jgi:hypothetical protein
MNPDDPLGIDEIVPPIGGADVLDANSGIESFINRGFMLAFTLFALYALLNFVLAAFSYLNAGGESKNVEKAQKMITQTFIGLALMSLTFVIAGIIGAVFFGDWFALLDLTNQLNNIMN